MRRHIERAQAGEPVGSNVHKAPARDFEEVAVLVYARAAASSGKLSAKRMLPVHPAAGTSGSARSQAAATRFSGREGQGSGPRDRPECSISIF